MGEDIQDKPELHDREHVGIGGGFAPFIGIDAKHLDIDGHDEQDEKVHRDHSWKTKAEEEPDGLHEPDQT
jgi:hypothetical protein